MVICIHFGFDESQYNKKRRQSDGLKAVKDAVNIPVSCAADTLEEAIEFINNDELVEITPTDIRVRKKYLTSLDRRRHARELGKLEEEEN